MLNGILHLCEQLEDFDTSGAVWSAIAQAFGRYFVQRQGIEWRGAVGLVLSTETGTNGEKRQDIWLSLSTDLYISLESPEDECDGEPDGPTEPQ
jgi:hypothetical protein